MYVIYIVNIFIKKNVEISLLYFLFETLTVFSDSLVQLRLENSKSVLKYFSKG